MKFQDFINSLSEEELEDYAERCGTTPNYIRVHLFHARKEPRKKLREALAYESRGDVSINEVLQHFGMAGGEAA